MGGGAAGRLIEAIVPLFDSSYEIQLGSMEFELSTTLTAEDGSATITVTTGIPTSLTLTGATERGFFVALCTNRLV